MRFQLANLVHDLCEGTSKALPAIGKRLGPGAYSVGLRTYR